MNGFLLVDKASGMTSHDVVAKMRKRFETKRVGHAGTLDPMATGVLVLGIGSATRLLQYVTDGSKSYDATIRLGQSTHTDDFEGDVLTTTDAQNLTDLEITDALKQFVGTIMQRPSSVSAIKIAGKTAHQRVRDGEEVDIPAREVTITRIEVKSISRVAQFVDVEVSVDASVGTYIRAIARDLGEVLKVGGHLTILRRTLVSPFSLAECKTLELAEPISVAEGISRILEVRTLDNNERIEISFGRTISASKSAGPIAALDSSGEFVALILNKTEAGKEIATPILVSVKE